MVFRKRGGDTSLENSHALRPRAVATQSPRGFCKTATARWDNQNLHQNEERKSGLRLPAKEERCNAYAQKVKVMPELQQPWTTKKMDTDFALRDFKDCS